MNSQGKITFWDDKKGYGFIKSQEHEKIFVHIKSFKNTKKRPQVGTKVRFTLRKDNSGRLNATNASIKAINFSFVFALIFLAILAVLTYLEKLPTWFSATYFLMSAMTFIAYAKDKNAARKHQWRTPELSLHLIALFCGWPGALIAQQTLRHKSSKVPFRIILWITIFCNLSLVVLALSPKGNDKINRLTTNIKTELKALFKHK